MAGTHDQEGMMAPIYSIVGILILHSKNVLGLSGSFYGGVCEFFEQCYVHVLLLLLLLLTGQAAMLICPGDQPNRYKNHSLVTRLITSKIINNLVGQVSQKQL